MTGTAARAVAAHLRLSLAAVDSARRTPTSYFTAAMFLIDGTIYCAPRKGQRVPGEASLWTRSGEAFGRAIWSRPLGDH